MSLRDDLRVMRGYEDIVGHDHGSTHARAHGYWTTEREHYRTEGRYGDSVEATADQVERRRADLDHADDLMAEAPPWWERDRAERAENAAQRARLEARVLGRSTYQEAAG
jgi:hypothetical protein